MISGLQTIFFLAKNAVLPRGFEVVRMCSSHHSVALGGTVALIWREIMMPSRKYLLPLAPARSFIPPSGTL